MPYKFLEHTADIKVLVTDLSLEKAFSLSALALREVILDFDKIKIKADKTKILSIEGKDLESLLYNFLEEFIYLLDAEDFIIGEVEDIEITSQDKSFNLTAKILGDKASSYKFSNKVKAITYNDMFVKEETIGKNRSAKSEIKLQFVLDV
jgi:SHS2 domain-containing protein